MKVQYEVRMTGIECPFDENLTRCARCMIKLLVLLFRTSKPRQGLRVLYVCIGTSGLSTVHRKSVNAERMKRFVKVPRSDCGILAARWEGVEFWGFKPEKLAKVSSSLIMHNSLSRSTFTRTAIEIHGNIRKMHAFILKHRKDYTDTYRSTEKDRDSIEHEVGLFVKACRESVEALKDSIGAEEKKSERSGWLGALSKSTVNKDLNAHQHGMVLILSEYLHAVTTQFDNLRAGRFQDAIEKRLPKRRRGLEGLKPASAVSTEAGIESSSSAERQNLQNMGNERFQSQQLQDDETRTLQVELTNLMDTVQETERKMLEVSALNHLFSSHVLKQAQQIEKLYQQALDATQNVDKANLELAKAIQRSSSSRLYILLVIIVLSFGLLFLDWYE